MTTTGPLITMPLASDSTNEKVKAVLANLTSMVPADAMTIYLAAYRYLHTATDLWLLVLLGLLILLFVRRLARATVLYTVLSVVAYLLWVLMVGDGPFQMLLPTLNPIWGTVLVLTYTSVATALASAGKIKG